MMPPTHMVAIYSSGHSGQEPQRVMMYPVHLSPALKQQLRWLMPMEAFDQIRVKDKCDDYELGHSASACMH
jgi:hypothetical protein